VVGVLREIPGLKLGRTEAPESKEIGEVSQAVIDATLPHLPAVVADMVRLQQLLGCRPGEICGIKPGMVNRSKAVWEIVLKRHKTASRGKSRCIYVGPAAQKIMLPYLERDPESHCFSPTEAMQQRRAAVAAKRVTPANQGNRRGYGTRTRQEQPSKPKRLNLSYTTSSYGHAIKYACKLAWPPPKGLSEVELAAWRRQHSWSPNQLRHSAGSQIREAFGLEHVAAVLGHSDIDTSKIYAKLRRDQAIEAAMTR
jgi:integrase